MNIQQAVSNELINTTLVRKILFPTHTIIIVVVVISICITTIRIVVVIIIVIITITTLPLLFNTILDLILITVHLSRKEMAGKKIVEYSFLGNSGLKISNICLGTMTFGSMPEDDGPFGVVCLISSTESFWMSFIFFIILTFYYNCLISLFGQLCTFAGVLSLMVCIFIITILTVLCRHAHSD